MKGPALRRAAALSFLFALVIVGVLYMMQAGRARKAAAQARATGEVFSVKHDLVRLARAEHAYFLHHGRYVSLEDLGEEGDTSCSVRSYTCEADLRENSFRITAVYQGRAESAWPRRISIDEKFEFRTEE